MAAILRWDGWTFCTRRRWLRDTMRCVACSNRTGRGVANVMYSTGPLSRTWHRSLVNLMSQQISLTVRFSVPLKQQVVHFKINNNYLHFRTKRPISTWVMYCTCGVCAVGGGPGGSLGSGGASTNQCSAATWCWCWITRFIAVLFYVNKSNIIQGHGRKSWRALKPDFCNCKCDFWLIFSYE